MPICAICRRAYDDDRSVCEKCVPSSIPTELARLRTENERLRDALETEGKHVEGRDKHIQKRDAELARLREENEQLRDLLRHYHNVLSNCVVSDAIAGATQMLLSVEAEAEEALNPPTEKEST